MIEFKRQRYGADMATILDEPHKIVEVQRFSNGLFDLTVHSLDSETGVWDDLTAILKPEHFIALGQVADNTLCIEPECPSFKKPPSRSCKCHPRNNF